MSNPLKGEASLTVGDRTYKLAFTTNSICTVEEDAGVGFDVMVQNMGRLSYARALLWAAMQRNHGELLKSDVGSIMDEAGLDKIGPALGRALSIAFPKRSGEKNG